MCVCKTNFNQLFFRKEKNLRHKITMLSVCLSSQFLNYLVVCHELVWCS
jgi:hypothetical protein